MLPILYLTLAFQTPLLPNLDLDRVARIEMSLDQKPITLTKQGNRWVLPDWNNYPADPVYTKLLLKTLKDAKQGRIVARNPKTFPYLGFDPPTKTVRLLDTEGALLGQLQVGKPVRNYQSAWVRIASNEIQEIDAPLVPVLQRITWASRTIWQVAEPSILGIETYGFDQDIEITQKDGSWTLIGPDKRRLAKDFRNKTLAFLKQPRAGMVERVDAGSAPFEANAHLRLFTQHVVMELYIEDLTTDPIRVRYADQPVIYLFSPKFADIAKDALAPIP